MTTVLFAPDSFKGSLTSVEVARALADGWHRARPDDELLLTPLADGGEGTLAAIAAAGGWLERTSPTVDPIGRPIDAPWLRSADGTRAVVELAAASGLSRLAAGERDPLGATTVGTGLLIRAVLDAGARRIVLGIGGSATNDGGAGILDALGAWVEPDRIDLAGLDVRLAGLELLVACDVTIRSSVRPARPPPTGRRKEPHRRTSRPSTNGSPAMPTCSRRSPAGTNATPPVPGRPEGSASPCSA